MLTSSKGPVLTAIMFLPWVIFGLQTVQREAAALAREDDGSSGIPTTTAASEKVLGIICFFDGQICISQTSYYVFVFAAVTFFVLLAAFLILLVLFIRGKMTSLARLSGSRPFERLEEAVPGEAASESLSRGVPDTSTPVRQSPASRQSTHPEDVGSFEPRPLEPDADPVPESNSSNNVEINVRSLSSSDSKSGDSESVEAMNSTSSYSDDSASPVRDANVTNRSNASRFHG